MQKCIANSLADAIEALRSGNNRSGIILLAHCSQFVQTLDHLFLVTLIATFVAFPATASFLLCQCRIGGEKNDEKHTKEYYRKGI